MCGLCVCVYGVCVVFACCVHEGIICVVCVSVYGWYESDVCEVYVCCVCM